MVTDRSLNLRTPRRLSVSRDSILIRFDIRVAKNDWAGQSQASSSPIARFSQCARHCATLRFRVRERFDFSCSTRAKFRPAWRRRWARRHAWREELADVSSGFRAFAHRARRSRSRAAMPRKRCREEMSGDSESWASRSFSRADRSRGCTGALFVFDGCVVGRWMRHRLAASAAFSIR